MKRIWAVSGIVGALVALTMPAQMAFAGGEDASTPLPVLTAEWWQWEISIPSDHNPQLDTTGEDCMVGQRGLVWFLAGVGAGGPATRTCSVPEGNTLFFPVINYVNINAPNVCGQGPENMTVKEMRASSKAFIDPVTNVKVQVDDHKDVKARRVQSQVFEVAIPGDNVFNAPCGGPGTVPAGIYSPAVDDGYYVILEPLKPGKHTIHFQAEQPSQPKTDVIYDLTVIPVLLK